MGRGGKDGGGHEAVPSKEGHSDGTEVGKDVDKFRKGAGCSGGKLSVDSVMEGLVHSLGATLNKMVSALRKHVRAHMHSCTHLS